MNPAFSKLFTVLFVFSLFTAASQNRKTCGTVNPPAEWDAWFNQKVEAYKAAKAASKSQPVTLTIPVIVHVIHGGQNVGVYPNLSATQIRSQIKVLNDDFAGKGYGVSNLAATGFSAVGAADTKITFCLAQYDPDGQALAEPGIDRISYASKGWSNPNTFATPNNFQAYIDGTVKPASIWDPTYYFNIWISDVNLNAGLLGYATFPAGSTLSGVNSNLGSTLSDGIWVWSKSFGNTGSLDPTYNRGRTAVHETGHWLGLRHIGGDSPQAAGDCNATDYCNDTPPQKGGFAGGTNGQNFGAPTYPLHLGVCNSSYGDMFMNFMDYCDDVVLNMFTPDQNDRMQTAMQNAAFRVELSTSSATQCVGLPVIDFDDVQHGCLETPQPLQFLYSGSSASYTWSASPQVTFSPNANDAAPFIQYPSPGSYTVTVILSNTIGVTVSQAVVEVSNCTGLVKLDQQGLVNMWPVPASQLMRISYPGGGSSSETLEVRMVDGTGTEVVNRKLAGQTSGVYEIQVDQLADGIYFVILQRGEQKVVKKVVVSH